MIFHALNYVTCVLLSNPNLYQGFKWVGNALLVSAAISVAVSPDWAQAAWPFVLYNAGTAVWLYAAVLMKDTPFICLQLFYAAVNTYGIVTRL